MLPQLQRGEAIARALFVYVLCFFCCRLRQFLALCLFHLIRRQTQIANYTFKYLTVLFLAQKFCLSLTLDHWQGFKNVKGKRTTFKDYFIINMTLTH